MNVLIVDEAHYIKNRSTQRARRVVSWLQATDRVMFLTGTPMENRVNEFANLISYLQPQIAHQVNNAHARGGPPAVPAVVAPVYLRRNQIDVLDELPGLVESLDWLDATVHDAQRYRAAVEAGSFMDMRRAAYVRTRPHQKLTGVDLRASAKLDHLMDIAAEARESGYKLVVFSYFRDVLNAAVEALSHVLPGAVYGPLTGDVTPLKRQAMVDALSGHRGSAALVAQIEAGGVGVNIQAASIVVLCEPQWKPTVEDQAIARCNRMGQTRKVRVHRLLLDHTVDRHMLQVLAGKREIFDAVARRSMMRDSTPAAVAVDYVRGSQPLTEVEERATKVAIITFERERLQAF
jgi:SNF2 family DNA or RNA helicase